MAYEKQTWQTGDIVTADKLNHTEDGIVDATGGGDVLCVTFSTSDGETWSADKTYSEVVAAIKAGAEVHAVAENAIIETTFYIQCIALMESQSASGVMFEYTHSGVPNSFGIVLLSNDTVIYQEINNGRDPQ